MRENVAVASEVEVSVVGEIERRRLVGGGVKIEKNGILFFHIKEE